jgi:hypothetical protein
MQQTMHRMFLTSLIGLLLSSCAACTGSYYTPRIRDVTEEPIDGNYWYQKFTLYNPANSTMDCLMSRTGQKLDLNSPAELNEIWRKNCRYTTDFDSKSSDSN